jgi:hypothetical protein
VSHKYAHAKLDGHSLTLEPAFAWTKSFINIKPQLEFMELPQVPYGMKVHGELWAPGVKASSIKTLIKEQADELMFTAWAVEGIDPATPLEKVLRWCDTHTFEYAPFWRYEERPTALPEYAEGWVFKDGNMLNVVKWKPVKTIDLVVLGIQPGKPGKYFGKVGALIVGIGDRVIANVSGMSDAERDEMSEADVGKVVEVEYQYVGSGGKLRHPVFVRFRDDKLPSQCLLSQDPDL